MGYANVSAAAATSIFRGDPLQVYAEGTRVEQYGPEWQAHVAAGGEVRNGNILIGGTDE